MEVDGERLTALDYAIIGQHQEVAQLLIEQGALSISGIQELAATMIQKVWRGYRTRTMLEAARREGRYVLGTAGLILIVRGLAFCL